MTYSQFVELVNHMRECQKHYYDIPPHQKERKHAALKEAKKAEGRVDAVLIERNRSLIQPQLIADPVLHR